MSEFFPLGTGRKRTNEEEGTSSGSGGRAPNSRPGERSWTFPWEIERYERKK